MTSIKGIRVKGITKTRYVLTMILMSLSSPTFAGQFICCIDHVTPDVSGVRVYFSTNADIGGQFSHRPAENERRYSVRQGRVVWPTREDAALLMQPGEISVVVAGAENTCEIAFALVDGRAGISARASFTPPGVQSHADTFIPAKLVVKDEQAALDRNVIARRGVAFRTEVESHYRDLKVRDSVQSGNDVKNIALKYLNVGMRFEDAEEILHAANCAVSERHLFSLPATAKLDEQMWIAKVDGICKLMQVFGTMAQD